MSVIVVVYIALLLIGFMLVLASRQGNKIVACIAAMFGGLGVAGIGHTVFQMAMQSVVIDLASWFVLIAPIGIGLMCGICVGISFYKLAGSFAPLTTPTTHKIKKGE